MAKINSKKQSGLEWPTLLLLVIVYGSFATLTIYATTVTLWLAMPALAVLIALHSSLQHEVLHGHPFGNQTLSELTVFPAIGLFIPYLRFKKTHLQHHYDPNLTDPYDDPESNYLDAVVFETMPPVMQRLMHFNTTLLGRITVGPLVSTGFFYREEIIRLARGERDVWLAWVHHACGVMLVMGWLSYCATLPLWAYGVAAYLGLSLLKIRTFLEHQAHERAAARSVIVEDKGIFALLFLNNNYHAVHHAYPRTPWYQLPAIYRAHRDEFLRRNGGYRYASYRQIFGLYFLIAKDGVSHPYWTRSNRSDGR
ncbi:MAG: fatty acid desaturase [Pseudomonadota bacterium]